MIVIRIWGSSFLLAALTPALFLWARRQSEEQIDKMQEAAFNTPGAEAPIPATVPAAAAGLLAGHFVVGRAVFGLRIWQSVLSLLLGLAAGVTITLLRMNFDEAGDGDLP